MPCHRAAQLSRVHSVWCGRCARQAQDRRWRIEHAQIVHPDDIARIARLGILPSMQPSHATSDMRYAEARLGPERLAGAYAWNSMLAAGVAALPMGSDFPVESANPFWGMYAAIARQDADGQPDGGWRPWEVRSAGGGAKT